MIYLFRPGPWFVAVIPATKDVMSNEAWVPKSENTFPVTAAIEAAVACRARGRFAAVIVISSSGGGVRGVIVSGGRGLGGPEPFKQLQALADTIGAQMAASRAACDAGWVPASWQVGQTGKKVAPELYLAIAISGASQHIMGIADSKIICAINHDADAPIFKHCRFGPVADYQKVVDPLREKLGHSK